jgi:pilus assembly protein CpaD
MRLDIADGASRRSIAPGKRRTRPPIAGRLRAAAAIAAVGIAITAITGCGESARVSDEFHPRLTDPLRRHPIVMVAETATLDLAGATGDKGLEARAFIETTRFVRNFRHEGRGTLNIAVPRGSGSGISRRVHHVRNIAWRNGVPPERIRVVSRRGHGGVTLSYDRIAAVGPTCGDWSEDVTRNRQNLPYPNYGCAHQRNLAAMTANPTDLVVPAAETPRGSDTRASDNKNFNQRIGKDAPSPGAMSVR